MKSFLILSLFVLSITTKAQNKTKYLPTKVSCSVSHDHYTLFEMHLEEGSKDVYTLYWNDLDSIRIRLKSGIYDSKYKRYRYEFKYKHPTRKNIFLDITFSFGDKNGNLKPDSEEPDTYFFGDYSSYAATEGKLNRWWGTFDIYTEDNSCHGKVRLIKK